MSLAAWVVSAVGQATRLTSAEGVLERSLEDWIGARPDLALDGVTWLARQLVFPDHSRLDLLGLTPDDKWVIAELKAAQVSHGTLVQAMHYAVSLGVMDASDLRARLETNPYFQAHVDPTATSHVFELLAAESDQAEARTVSILLIGTGKSDALDRSVAFLEQHGLDIAVDTVSFDLFTTPAGETLLVRDVEEGPPAGAPATSVRSIEAVMSLARERGVAEPLKQVIDMADSLGFPVKPWPLSVTVTAVRRGNPTLLYVRPQPDNRLHVWVSHENMAKHLGTSPEALAALGTGGNFTADEVALWLPKFVAATAPVAGNDSGESPTE